MFLRALKHEKSLDSSKHAYEFCVTKNETTWVLKTGLFSHNHQSISVRRLRTGWWNRSELYRTREAPSPIAHRFRFDRFQNLKTDPDQSKKIISGPDSDSDSSQDLLSRASFKGAHEKCIVFKYAGPPLVAARTNFH